MAPTRSCCTRRHRDAACQPRSRQRAVQQQSPPPLPHVVAASSCGPNLDGHLMRVLAGDASSLDALTGHCISHGWKLPPPARREGGLWMLDPDRIATLPPPPTSSPEYGQLWFEQMFDYQLGERRLPHIDCSARPAGSPLPARSLELVRAGMCCVLERPRLWPAAEEKWGSAAYLRRELKDVKCNVLSSPAASRRFSYWFDSSAFSDRVQAGYKAKPVVTSLDMSVDSFLDASKKRPAHTDANLLYLQQSLLITPNDRPGLMPCAGLGEGMRRDIEQGIDGSALRALAEAGGFGPWQRCQLFVGGAAAEGARSILHFDQYDNLFVQIKGSKTFRIYDPQQTPALYPYPIHHPLDTRSQVDLERPDHAAFPRLATATGVTITLRPGQLLFLPAYWWHEVLTDPIDADSRSGQPLTVSVNFWFAATARLLSPTRPLVPSMHCELARQLEYLISDCLHDRAHHVPRFFASLLAALEAGRSTSAIRDVHSALLRQRPDDVAAAEWTGLFQFVVWKLAMLVGPRAMVSFVHDLCHPSRFEQLRIETEHRGK